MGDAAREMEEGIEAGKYFVDIVYGDSQAKTELTEGIEFIATHFGGYLCGCFSKGEESDTLEFKTEQEVLGFIDVLSTKKYDLGLRLSYGVCRAKPTGLGIILSELSIRPPDIHPN